MSTIRNGSPGGRNLGKSIENRSVLSEISQTNNERINKLSERL